MCSSLFFTSILSKKKYFIHIDVLHACMPMHIVCEVPTEARRRTPDSIDLELEKVVSLYVDSGN